MLLHRTRLTTPPGPEAEQNAPAVPAPLLPGHPISPPDSSSNTSSDTSPDILRTPDRPTTGAQRRTVPVPRRTTALRTARPQLVLKTLTGDEPHTDPQPGAGRPVRLPAAASADRPTTTSTSDTSAAERSATGPDTAILPAVTRAAQANRRALSLAEVPDRATVRGLVRAGAVHLGLDPSLALAVAAVESGFDQKLVSPANAIGVMQVQPSAGAWAAERLGQPLDLFDARDNVLAGAVLLRALLQRVDEQTALAGYYQGLDSVRRHGTLADTRRYIATVRTLKLRFR